jgi:hypothetical protein
MAKKKPTQLDKLTEQYPDMEFLKADGFDNAVIGFDEREERLIYDVESCISILMKRDKMSYEGAIEYFDFNVSGAYVGEKTPIWCRLAEGLKLVSL